MGEKGQIVRSSALFAALTLVSRVFGYTRDLARAYFLGTSYASDAFGVAITIPNLFRRLLAEGAMSAAVVPVLADLKDGDRATLSDYLNRVLTLMTALLALATVAGALLSPLIVPELFARGFRSEPEKLALTVQLTQITFFYLLFVGLAAFVQAILNTFKVFGPSAFSPVLLNLAVIAAALGVGPFIEQPAYAFAAGYVVGGLLQLVFQIPYLWRLSIRLRPRLGSVTPQIRRSLRLMGPAIIGFGVYETNVALSQLFATYLDEGSVSSLQYSNRMMELPLGVFVTAVGTVILPTLSEMGHRRQMADYTEHLAFALRLVLFVSAPVTAVLLVLRTPLLEVLLGYGSFGARSVEMTSWAFLFHLTGLPLVGLTRIMVPAFYSLEDTRTPVQAAMAAMVVNLAAAWLLAFPLGMGNGGIALGASVSAAVQAALLLALLRRRRGVALPWRPIVRESGKVLLAAAVAAAAALLCLPLFDGAGRIMSATLLAAISAATAVLYLALLLLMRSQDLTEGWKALRRRLRRGKATP